MRRTIFSCLFALLVIPLVVLISLSLNVTVSLLELLDKEGKNTPKILLDCLVTQVKK